jgi:hypothetical protein
MSGVSGTLMSILGKPKVHTNYTYFMVTLGANVYGSNDGLTWNLLTNFSSQFDPVGDAVAWLTSDHSGTLVVVTELFYVFTSTDHGYTWTQTFTSPDDTTYAGRMAVYGNGKFVAVGTNYIANDVGVVLASSDGITWTQTSLTAADLSLSGGVTGVEFDQVVFYPPNNTYVIAGLAHGGVTDPLNLAVIANTAVSSFTADTFTPQIGFDPWLDNFFAYTGNQGSEIQNPWNISPEIAGAYNVSSNRGAWQSSDGGNSWTYETVATTYQMYGGIVINGSLIVVADLYDSTPLYSLDTWSIAGGGTTTKTNTYDLASPYNPPSNVAFYGITDGTIFIVAAATFVYTGNAAATSWSPQTVGSDTIVGLAYL